MITATAVLNGTIYATAVIYSTQVGNCASATAVLKNTLGTTLSTTSIPSGDSEDIIAPDAHFRAQNIDNTYSIVSDTPSGESAAFLIINTEVSVKNSLGNQIASDSLPSGVSGDVLVPDVDNVDSDGSTVPTPAGVVFTCTPQVKDLFSKFTFETGDDTASTVTIDADSAGTYTSSAQDGASGTITFDINSGGFGAFVNPTVLAIGDTIAVKRTVTTALGWVKITGTYV